MRQIGPSVKNNYLQIRLPFATKDVLPTSMQDETEDKDKDYPSLPHKQCYELLYTIETKGNRKLAADQIKRLADSKAVSTHSDSNTSANMPRKKKSSTAVLPSRKKQGRKNPNHKGSQCYCVLCKNYVMPEHKYTLHSS